MIRCAATVKEEGAPVVKHYPEAVGVMVIPSVLIYLLGGGQLSAGGAIVMWLVLSVPVALFMSSRQK